MRSEPRHGDVHARFDAILERYVAKAPQLQVWADGPGINEYQYPYGSSDQPFHAASVGKLFTAALLFQLIGEGRLRLSDKVVDILPSETCRGLFLHKGRDLSDQVTVRHLMMHSSGLADHFLDRPRKGPKFVRMVLDEPDRMWTPQGILRFYRENYTLRHPPGEGFHYSDTGFILLGLVIEACDGRAFHECLQERVLKPLGMRRTHLMFYSRPQEESPMSRLFFNGIDATEFPSLSADWAGGGMVCSPRDLATFTRAFFEGRLFPPEILTENSSFPNVFRRGIHYGTSMMELHMEGFMPTLKGYPRLRGHLGILAAHAWYDPGTGRVFVLGFGHNRAMGRSFRSLIRMLAVLKSLDAGYRP
ncbi:MAG: serine hydrolase domain-containing protein [Candidatus Methanomethylophilaceae archaeon]